MKSIFAPILLLTFLSPSLAYGETMNDLVRRDGIHYKKFSEVPFTGKVTGKTQGIFKNGKMLGPYITFWNNGQLWTKGTHKDGKRVGPFVGYYKNGQLASKGTFRDDKWEGLWVGYELDGTVSEERTGTFKNGKKVSD